MCCDDIHSCLRLTFSPWWGVTWRPKVNYLDHVSKDSGSFMLKKGNPEILLLDNAVVDSGCSNHMTGNKGYLSDYEDFNGGFMAFGSDPKGGKRPTFRIPPNLDDGNYTPLQFLNLSFQEFHRLFHKI
ncbi:hypothetical protein Tco_0757108 [Tanacetum coccineum]